MQIELLSSQSFVDGSGLSALFRIDGVTVGCEYIGKISAHVATNSRGLSGVSIRKEQSAIKRASAEFAKIVDSMGPRFFELNHAMYC